VDAAEGRADGVAVTLGLTRTPQPKNARPAAAASAASNDARLLFVICAPRVAYPAARGRLR
jgi:hypothetical protein